MEDELFMTQFFEWVEANEETYDFPIAFESIENGVLRCQIDSSLVEINIGKGEMTPKTNSSLMNSTCETIEDKLVPNMPFQELLDLVVSTYQEIKEFEDDEEDEENNMNDFAGRPEAGFVGTNDFAQNHFIFREAEEAIKLLQETIMNFKELEFSCQITSNPSAYSIRVEIDLAFLRISDRSMVFLDLNYESTMVISLTLEPNFLLQSMDSNKWTRTLMGGFLVEVFQGGSSDSYACKTYLPGRVQKFFLDMAKMIANTQEIPSLMKIASNSYEENDEPASNVIPELVDTLLAMGYPYYRSVRALANTGNNIDACIDYLASEAETETGFFGHMNRFLIPTDNLIYNLLFYLRDRLQNCTNYCVICYKKHPSDCVRMRPCSGELCQFKFEEISGVSIYTETKMNPDLVLLDLSFAAEALSSGRAKTVFEPFPSFMLKTSQLRGKSGFLERQAGKKYTSDMDENKDIERLIECFRHIPDPLDIIHRCKDEEAVSQLFQNKCNRFHIECAKLYKYIIATNRLDLVKLSHEQTIRGISNEIDQYIVTNHSPETMRLFNEKKAKHGSIFAFHGSAIENWYSILRNGIRNLSNTHMMTAGAASGAGVYTAENISTSLGYCRFGSSGNVNWEFSILNNCGCIAIVEIINNQKEYKNGGVFVVRNDEDLIIRYLLVFRSYNGSANFGTNSLPLSEHIAEFERNFYAKDNERHRKRITDAIKKAQRRKIETEQYAKLTQKRKEEEEKAEVLLENKLQKLSEQFSGHGSASANKRIMQEYKYLIKSKECKGLSVEFEGDSNLYVWIVSLDMNQFDVDKNLKKDFEQYSRKYNAEMKLIFEVRFDSNFPFNPPFLRVVKPRFQFRTGHITVGGSICMESLTPSGWIPVRTIESVFIEILFNLGEGGAKLDLKNAGQEYTLQEAQEAFTRVARQHNWI